MDTASLWRRFLALTPFDTGDAPFTGAGVQALTLLRPSVPLGGSHKSALLEPLLAGMALGLLAACLGTAVVSLAWLMMAVAVAYLIVTELFGLSLDVVRPAKSG